MSKLTHARLKEISSKKVPGKYSDGNNLFLRVTSSGAMRWQMKVKTHRETIVSFGPYPEVSLADARVAAQTTRQQIRAGADPNLEKRRLRLGKQEAYRNNFESVARDWYSVKHKEWSVAYGPRLLRRLELHVFRSLGANPISEIRASEALAVLRRIQAAGTLETARRAAVDCSRIFQYAMRAGLAESNPFLNIGQALEKPVVKHMPALLVPEKLAVYLKAVRAYRGRGVVVSIALQLLPMLLLRPGELRAGDWSEVDWVKS